MSRWKKRRIKVQRDYLTDSMRDEDFVNRDPVFTLREPWITYRGKDHWYTASTEFCRQALDCFTPGTILVIGSSLLEVEMLQNMGWRVTYLDIRQPPREANLKDFVQADVRDIPFPEETFDAVSSACVVCHVGLGRYGDTVSSDGDEQMMKEVSRVLKKEGPAVITFGPVTKRHRSVRHGNVHRVYNLKEVKRICELAGMEIQESRIWDTFTNEWVSEADDGVQPSKYLSTVLRRI